MHLVRRGHFRSRDKDGGACAWCVKIWSRLNSGVQQTLKYYLLTRRGSKAPLADVPFQATTLVAVQFAVDEDGSILIRYRLAPASPLDEVAR